MERPNKVDTPAPAISAEVIYKAANRLTKESLEAGERKIKLC